MSDTKEQILGTALRTIEVEIEGLKRLQDFIDKAFVDAINLILKSEGKVVMTGMGKSGLIASKIAATLSSTGTSSVFLHPAEAVHGDLGVLQPGDVVIAISYSGESDELIRLIPVLRKLEVSLLSITGNLESTLAKFSAISLCANVEKEACPLELAPTASTTSALALGDAIAMCLMEQKRFKEIDFAIFHPGGSLGRRLLRTVADEMRQDNLPTSSAQDKVEKVILTISSGMLGLCVVIDENASIIGLVTDGDLRNAMSIHRHSLLDMTVDEIMNDSPTILEKNRLIYEAEQLMQELKINSILVHENGRLVGILSQRELKYNPK